MSKYSKGDIKDCLICKKPYTMSIHNQKYCHSCREEYSSPFRKKRLFPKNVCTSTVGAIGEYLVVADLLSKGYEVFKAASSSCSCDLAILKDGKLIRIEVRTGYLLANGKDYYTNIGKFRADIMATVGHEHKKIIYSPEL